MTILWDSPRGPGMKILVMVFYHSLWEDLVETLVKSPKRMRFWHEVLMSIHSVASCAKTNCICCNSENLYPDLLLFHRFWCFYLAHWLPNPHTVWSLLPEYFYLLYFSSIQKHVQMPYTLVSCLFTTGGGGREHQIVRRNWRTMWLPVLKTCYKLVRKHD